MVFFFYISTLLVNRQNKLLVNKYMIRQQKHQQLKKNTVLTNNVKKLILLYYNKSSWFFMFSKYVFLVFYYCQQTYINSTKLLFEAIKNGSRKGLLLFYHWRSKKWNVDRKSWALLFANISKFWHDTSNIAESFNQWIGSEKNLI